MKPLIHILVLILVVAGGDLALAEEAAKTASSLGVYTPPDTTASLFKVTLGLGVVVLAIVASAWLFRRLGGKAFISNDAMRVIGGLSVTQRDRVVLLQVGKEQVLIGVSPGRLQTLHVLKEPVDVSPQQEPQGAFADKLNSALQHWKKS